MAIHNLTFILMAFSCVSVAKLAAAAKVEVSFDPPGVNDGGLVDVRCEYHLPYKDPLEMVVLRRGNRNMFGLIKDGIKVEDKFKEKVHNIQISNTSIRFVYQADHCDSDTFTCRVYDNQYRTWQSTATFNVPDEKPAPRVCLRGEECFTGDQEILQINHVTNQSVCSITTSDKQANLKLKHFVGNTNKYIWNPKCSSIGLDRCLVKKEIQWIDPSNFKESQIYRCMAVYADGSEKTTTIKINGKVAASVAHDVASQGGMEMHISSIFGCLLLLAAVKVRHN